MNFLRPALIIGTLPNTIANGQTADAVPLMADLNFIVNQVNANAAPLTNTALLNATNSFTQPQAGVSAAAVSQFPIVGDIITGGYQTLTSTLGTNAISARSTQIIPSSSQSGQAVFLIPSQTNTGAVSLNRDSLGSFAVLQMGSGLAGGELQAGVPVRLFLDGSNFHVVGPPNKARTLTAARLNVSGGAFAAPTNGNGFLYGDPLSGAIIYGQGSVADWTVLNKNGNSVVTNPTGTTTLSPVGLLDISSVTAGQIQFPAAQNASAGANVLDDYEEGTWTPSVGGSATYTIQSGTYTKVGRMVAIVGTISINNIGSGSTVTVSGLPFTSAANTAISVSSATALATNMVSVTAAIGAAGTTISFNGRTVASASESNSAIFGNGAGVNFSGIYFV